MKTHQIRSFIAVAEELNFTRAAERLGIAQPPLSLQIKQLESELRVRLFERSKHNVTLTQAGAALLEYAYRINELIADAQQTVRGISRGEIGQLKVAFNGSVSRIVLPRLLHRYRKMRPNVQLILTDLTSAQQIDALDRGEIHIAITRSPVQRSRIEITRLKWEPLCLVVPRDHAMATPRRLTGGDIGREPLVLCSRKESPAAYEKVLQTCSKFDFTPNVLFHITSIHSLLDLVGLGMAIAILPEGMKDLKSDGIVFRPIVDGELTDICVTHRTGPQSELVTEFVEVAKAEFKKEMKRPLVTIQDENAVEIAGSKGR